MQNTDPKFLERWANVYTLATSIPEDIRFNISTWGKHEEISECGTAACLAGHAALHPWFRDRGLSTAIDSFDTLRPSLAICMTGGEASAANYRWKGWLNTFFGVDSIRAGAEDSHLPFWPRSYISDLEEDGNERVIEEREKFGEVSESTLAELVTPSMCARKTRDWMERFWPPEEVMAAIDNATAVYDIEAVHRFTPWSN